jgi:hypothetical protein
MPTPIAHNAHRGDRFQAAEKIEAATGANRGARADTGAEIARLTEQYGQQSKAELSPDDIPPQGKRDVPPQRPAALEPEWEGGRLTLPKRPAKTDLSGKKFMGALAALSGELRCFSEAIAGEANIDLRDLHSKSAGPHP